MKISEIAHQVRDRISSTRIKAVDYVSTDNMKPWFRGYEPGTTVPSGTLTAYQAGDILLSNIRPYFRKTWLATHDGGCNADVICIRANESRCVSEYLYYVFCTNGFVEDYLKGAKGAKMPRGDINRLLNYEIQLPEKADQLRIAGLLGSLDEKIAICRKKIAELEALAKLIYDRWFVEFEFPNADGRPYKSNGGKMVWNDSLKREIPDGWVSARLDSIVSDGGESIGATEVGNLPYTPIDSLPIRQVSFFDSKPSSEAQSSLIRYRKGDILLGAMRVYFHRVCIAPYDGVTRTTTIAMRPRCKELSAFSFETINTDRFIEYAVVQSNGSQQPFVTWSSIRDFSFAAPPCALGNAFDDQVSPLLDGIVQLERTAFEAARLRDWLLPMLMNGQVEVRA